jgi:hypothetical protein
MLSEFEETQQEAVAGFQRVMATLTERGKLP